MDAGADEATGFGEQADATSTPAMKMTREVYDDTGPIMSYVVATFLTAVAFGEGGQAARSVFCGSFHVVDHDHIGGHTLRIELEAELLLHSGEDRRRVGGHRDR